MTDTRKEVLINLDNMKSIFISTSFDNKLMVSVNIQGGYAYVHLTDEKVDQLIEALVAFKKELA